MKIVPDISVLYENSEFLLVDKKPGMAVHSGDASGSGRSETDEGGTLINHIKAYLWAARRIPPGRGAELCAGTLQPNRPQHRRNSNCGKDSGSSAADK